MEYVEYIRNMVGDETINLTGVNVIIINEKEEILLQKRGDYPEGKWGLPGGIVELGESLEDAAIREVKEETNLDVYNLELIGTTSGKYNYIELPNGHKLYCITIGYATKSFMGKLKIDGKESRDLRFFSKYELPENMPGSHKVMINIYYKG